MKYYKIFIKQDYDEMIATRANFIDESQNNNFKQINTGEIIYNSTVFDYFFLESYDEKKYWEWALFDAHNFIGNASHLSKCFLISEKLKKIFQKFKISNPHFYYHSKLLYKNNKLDYYIFQFTGNTTFIDVFFYINLQKSIFFDPVKRETIKVVNLDDFISTYKKIYKANGNENKLKSKKIVLKEKIDFIPLGTFMNDNIVSERLKQAIEENNITGFEFFELDYEVVVEQKM